MISSDRVWQVVFLFVSCCFITLAQTEAKQPNFGQGSESGLVTIRSIRSMDYRPYRDIAFSRGIPSGFPRIESQWQSLQKERYQKLLSRGTYDLMVVPFQVSQYAFDRPTRSLMTAELTYAVANRTGLKIPDPYLLYRALGEGERQYAPIEVNSLAKRLGVEKIIWVYVGHNRHNTMHLTVQALETGRAPTSSFSPGKGKKKFSNIPFSPETPPISVFNAMLPEILAALDMELAEKSQRLLTPPKQDIRLPERPLDLFLETTGDPVENAYKLQFLSYLTPSYAERTRERFIERSLLEVGRISPDSSSYRALKARAYMLLGFRPAAIDLLESPASNEERALLAALNGNLPELKQLILKIESQVGRVLSRFDENSIAAHSLVSGKTRLTYP